MKTEHIDRNGNLQVPVQRSTDDSPKREGWKPFWSSVKLSGWEQWEGRPQKIVHYKPDLPRAVRI